MQGDTTHWNNNATNSRASPGSILNALLHLKLDIESELPTFEVLISTSAKRTENKTARNIIDSSIKN